MRFAVFERTKRKNKYTNRILNHFLLKKYEIITQIIPTINITYLFSIRKSNRESTIPKIINKPPILFK